MAKKKRINIKLLSSSGSGHFYTSTKNINNTKKKISLKKYDPIFKKHFIYNEIKIR